MTLEPEVLHGVAVNAIQFRVVFPLGAKDTARGDYGNAAPGVVQPMLKWKTQYRPRIEPVAIAQSEPAGRLS